MDLLQAIEERHSVRSFYNQKIVGKTLEKLLNKIDEINEESGLHIQYISDEDQAFNSLLAHYGKFSNVRQYIALVGEKGKDLSEKIGYYGEELVLYAQTLGLNTCWVALTYKKVKDAHTIEDHEKLSMVIAIGYGTEHGRPHKSKSIRSITDDKELPDWYIKGLEAALLAPTAMNQQRFKFLHEGNTVTAEALKGFYTHIDLGIVKYNFEIGAGKENFEWSK